MYSESIQNLRLMMKRTQGLLPCKERTPNSRTWSKRASRIFCKIQEQLIRPFQVNAKKRNWSISDSTMASMSIFPRRATINMTPNNYFLKLTKTCTWTQVENSILRNSQLWNKVSTMNPIIFLGLSRKGMLIPNLFWRLIAIPWVKFGPGFQR